MRCLIAVLLVAASAAPARAQNGADIDLQGFRPAMDSRGFITVNAANVLEPGQLSLGLVTTWGRGLLRFEQGDNRYEVQHMITPTLVGAVGLGLLGLDLEIGGALPFTIMSGDRAPDSDGATPGDPNDDASYRFDGQGLADASLHLKWRLRPGGSGIGLALVGSLTLPTASASDRWLGDRSTVPQLVAVADHRAGRLALAANAGVRWRGAGERFSDDQPAGMAPLTRGVVESGSAVPFGVAVSYAVVPEKFDLLAELFGAAPLAGENLFPLEALGGVKLYLAKSSFLSFGAGAGLLGDRGGNPDARAFLAIVFEPRPGAVEGGRIADPVPVLVRAPDGDRDDDGIRDRDDGCPDVPEDHDGFQDRDGCPELDNDRDRIADADDLCIDRPEVYNTVEDEDGCPDRGPVIEREGEIELLEVIQFEFDSAVIRPESHGILRAVARTILLNPKIEKLEVQGHTDERGSAAYNLDLSRRRAASVLDFLVAEGVARPRLTSRGYGETRP
ncbi:MAG TPA: OmpA family protein, partial [Kofleriaceae bacterium]|nr:OmpA family protein [Kofleriaceae bacterium]